MYLSDSQLLEKFSINPMLDEQYLVDELIILYCHKKGIPVPNAFMSLRDQLENGKITDVSSAYVSDDHVLKLLIPLSSISEEYIASQQYVDLVYHRDYHALNERLTASDRKEFDELYSRIIVATLQSTNQFRHYNQCSFNMAMSMANIINTLSPTAISEELSAHSWFLKAIVQCADNPWDHDSCFDAFVALVRDAFGIISDTSKDEVPSKVVVTNYNIFSDKENWYISFFDKWQKDFACKYVIIPFREGMDDVSFIVKTAMDRQCLSEIIRTRFCDPEFGNPESILLLSMQQPLDSIRFKEIDSRGRIDYQLVKGDVSYEEVLKHQRNIRPEFYCLPELGEGEEYRELGEFCEFDYPLEPVNKAKKLPFYNYSDDFRRICLTSAHPLLEKYQNNLTSKIFEGPHIHISKTRSLSFQTKAIIVSKPGVYHIPYGNSFDLRIKDGSINPEYLVYKINRDIEFCMSYLAANPDDNEFMLRKVAVLKDRTAQDEFMKKVNESCEDVVKSDARYRVFIVESSSDPITTKEISAILDEWQIEISNVCSSVEEFNSCIEKAADNIDAVIMDPSVDSGGVFFKGLRTILSKTQKLEKALYVYSSIPQEDIENPLTGEESSYLRNGHIFDRTGSLGLKILITKLREELDRKGIPSAMMNGVYSKEFNAAKWIDSVYPKKHIASDLRFVLSQPNKALNNLRGITRNLLMIIVDGIKLGSGLEECDLGIVPTLLANGQCKDLKTQKIYFIEGSVMPKTLAFSLCYAREILNGASHTEETNETGSMLDVSGYIESSGSEHISRSVTNIVMELILWLQQCQGQFDGYCLSEGLNEQKKVDWYGPITRVNNKEYFCTTQEGKKVHIFIDPKKFKDGQIAHIIYVTKESSPANKDKYEYFAPSGCWELMK